ncbi:MAG: LysR substrate-binding domain-containing protein [bacterium]|nr:LysR family transcriptional regulator [Gammaproteobacteria bacterium]
MSEFNISKLRRLDGSLLLILHELIDCRNAKQVADRLSLSQSAISHALTRLRALFDDPLFIRKPHGLEPTTRALAMQSQLKEFLSNAEKLLNVQTDFIPASSRRLFSVAAPEYFTSLVASALVNHWKKVAPSMSVYYSQMPSTESIEDIRRGRLDLAIGRPEESLPSGLVQEVLYKDVYCVVARKKHPRIQRKMSNQQYQNESHVLASARSEVTTSESNIYPRMPSGIVVQNWMTAMSIVAESDCLATCHRKMAERFSGALGLQVLDPPFEPDVFTVSVVRRQSPDDGVRWLLGQIADVVS